MVENYTKDLKGSVYHGAVISILALNLLESLMLRMV